MIGRVKQWFVHTSLVKVVIKDFQSLLKMKETRQCLLIWNIFQCWKILFKDKNKFRLKAVQIANFGKQLGCSWQKGHKYFQHSRYRFRFTSIGVRAKGDCSLPVAESFENFGQNADDSARSTRKKTFWKVVNVGLVDYFLWRLPYQNGVKVIQVFCFGKPYMEPALQSQQMRVTHRTNPYQLLKLLYA